MQIQKSKFSEAIKKGTIRATMASKRKAVHWPKKQNRPEHGGWNPMARSFDSSTSPDTEPAGIKPSGWLRLGIVAGASALAGGIAAAWWYRKTLAKLRQADQPPSNPDSRIVEDEAADEG